MKVTYMVLLTACCAALVACSDDPAPVAGNGNGNGTATQGQTCSSTSDCASGLECVFTSQKQDAACMQACAAACAGDPACAAGCAEECGFTCADVCADAEDPAACEAECEAQQGGGGSDAGTTPEPDAGTGGEMDAGTGGGGGTPTGTCQPTSTGGGDTGTGSDAGTGGDTATGEDTATGGDIDWVGTWSVALTYQSACEGFGQTETGDNSHTVTLSITDNGNGGLDVVAGGDSSCNLTGTGNNERLALSGQFPVLDHAGDTASCTVIRDNNISLNFDTVDGSDSASGSIGGSFVGATTRPNCTVVEGGTATISR